MYTRLQYVSCILQEARGVRISHLKEDIMVCVIISCLLDPINVRPNGLGSIGIAVAQADGRKLDFRQPKTYPHLLGLC